MSEGLRVTLGQHSRAGRKSVNQDFHGAVIPEGWRLATKGIAIALADGIGSSEVAHLASAMAVRGFLDDYYATTEAWPVRRAAQRVLSATNSWLHAQTMRSDARFDKDRGLVCTFTALILKGREAHSLHVGDARIYRVHDQALEQLTDDHRVRVSSQQAYLARALGAGPNVDIDYRHWPTEAGEFYLLATDGAHEYLDAESVQAALAAHPHDFDAAAAMLADLAFERGSPDNLTLQLVRIDSLPKAAAPGLNNGVQPLIPPPTLAPRLSFEGFFIVRELHISPRSHVWLALDEESGRQVVLKTLSVDLREDPAQRDRLLLEDWVARRIDSPHVLKPADVSRPRSTLYSAMEFVEGQTLAQWMVDHPRPGLPEVRDIVEQIAKGLQAFHGKEMLHQDLRPENLMIDHSGTVRIIDFGAVHVPGLVEGRLQAQSLAGTLQYAAPEYFVGVGADARSDLFSLAVLTYQMLCGHLPYGLQVTRLRVPGDLARLRYADVRSWRPDLPAWVDAVLRKALQAQPSRRQQAVSEFAHDLRAPGPSFHRAKAPPLIERSPVAFWRTASALLAALVVLLLGLLLARR